MIGLKLSYFMLSAAISSRLCLPATSKGFEIQHFQARPPFAIQVPKPDRRGRTCSSHGFRQLAAAELVWEVRPETCSVIQV